MGGQVTAIIAAYLVGVLGGTLAGYFIARKPKPTKATALEQGVTAVKALSEPWPVPGPETFTINTTSNSPVLWFSSEA